MFANKHQVTRRKAEIASKTMMVVGATVHTEEAVVQYVFNSSHQLCKCGRVRLTNIWQIKRFLWRAKFTVLQSSYFFHDLLLYTLKKKKYIYICVCVCVYVYRHTYISDSVEILYELLLLPNDTASETF